tara:strand:- start:3853 stop:4236 length:384 start_codon:yes stop_codon:yes gene_type:complete
MLRDLLFCNNTSGAVSTMTVDFDINYIEVSYQPNGGYTSDLVTPTVTGGTSPYTYLWSRTGSGGASLGYTPSTKDMIFNASGTNQRYLSYFFCGVTDSSTPAKTTNNYVTLAIGFNVSAYPEGSETP